MDSGTRTQHAGDLDDSGYDATRRLISDEIRRARKAKGWSQSQLGEAIRASRYTIIRLEAGKQDLTPEVAEQLESALETEGLVALVTKREQLTDSDETRFDRDVVVRRLLQTPRLQRVRVVLADDLDISGMIAGNPALVDARVQVFVPTAARERELYHGQPIYGHLENQIKELSELADSWRSRGRGNFYVYESPSALSPAVLVRSPAGNECAYWPVIPSGPLVDGSEMQVFSSSDPSVTAQVEAHIEAVHATASRIWRNEALAIVDSQPRPKGENRPILFTRFAAAGEHADLEANEAATVGLVLIHTICPRPGLGMRRRVLVHSWSDDPDLWSLPGHAVEEVDVRRARWTVEGGDYVDPPRSSMQPLDAALEHAPYFEQSQGEIPIEVFKEAASRGLFRDFGIEVEVGRLDNVVLPPALQRISKERADAAGSGVRLIIPRLFTLDLSLVAGDGSTFELSEIKRRAHVEEWGYEDLLGRTDLNDFLTDAKEEGFLRELCRKLGVAPR